LEFSYFSFLFLSFLFSFPFSFILPLFLPSSLSFLLLFLSFLSLLFSSLLSLPHAHLAVSKWDESWSLLYLLRFVIRETSVQHLSLIFFLPWPALPFTQELATCGTNVHSLNQPSQLSLSLTLACHMWNKILFHLTSIQLGVKNLAFTSTGVPRYNNAWAFMDTYFLIINS
jgi:hypothetical protein